MTDHAPYGHAPRVEGYVKRAGSHEWVPFDPRILPPEGPQPLRFTPGQADTLHKAQEQARIVDNAIARWTPQKPVPERHRLHQDFLYVLGDACAWLARRLHGDT